MSSQTGTAYIPRKTGNQERHHDARVRRYARAIRPLFAQEVADPNGVSVLASLCMAMHETHRTEVATLNANGAWKVVEADTRRTD